MLPVRTGMNPAGMNVRPASTDTVAFDPSARVKNSFNLKRNVSDEPDGIVYLFPLAYPFSVNIKETLPGPKLRTVMNEVTF